MFGLEDFAFFVKNKKALKLMDPKILDEYSASLGDTNATELGLADQAKTNYINNFKRAVSSFVSEPEIKESLPTGLNLASNANTNKKSNLTPPELPEVHPDREKYEAVGGGLAGLAARYSKHPLAKFLFTGVSDIGRGAGDTLFDLTRPYEDVQYFKRRYPTKEQLNTHIPPGY